MASLDKDNNPRQVDPPIPTFIGAASANASLASSLNIGVDNQRHTVPSPTSSSSTHSRSSSSLNQQRLALLESPAFSYSAMSARSEEDFLGNIDGSSDPLFAAHSEENIGILNEFNVTSNKLINKLSNYLFLLENNSEDCPNDNATASTLVCDGSSGTLRRKNNCGVHQRMHPNNNDGSFSDSEEDDNYTKHSDNDNHQHCIQLSNEYYSNTDDPNLNCNEDNLSSNWDEDNQSSYSHQTSLYQDDELSSDTYINNKSTKELYKAVAKKLGITCKMSSQCRCIDCQSNYFDCEYEEVNMFLYVIF